MTQERRRTEAWLILAVAALAFFVQSAALNGVRFDDAYITYRYAQNLATGHGLVFNPGEHLLGTTSPGQALLGAPLYLLVGQNAFPAVMAVLGCLGWTVQAVCAYALLRDVVGRAGAAFVAIAIAAGASRAYFFVPLETNLVAALVLAAFVAAARHRWMTCGLLAGVAVVFRADAAIACAPLAVLAVREVRGRAWRPMAACAAVSMPWFAVSMAYYGTLVPHTLVAKVAHSTVKEYALYALSYPALSLAPWARVTDSGTQGSWLTIVGSWGLAIAGAVTLARRSSVLAALLAYATALMLAYVAMHPDPAFHWHLYPWLLVFALCSLTGLVTLAAPALRRLPRTPRIAVAVPLSAAVVAALGFEAVMFAEQVDSLPFYGVRDALDQTVAAYLRAAAAPTDCVDAEEVGTVAYLSGLPMVDHPGLVSDDAIGQLFAAARGKPSRVKWAVLNPWEAETGKADFSRFRGVVLSAGPLRVVVLDLRAPAR